MPDQTRTHSQTMVLTISNRRETHTTTQRYLRQRNFYILLQIYSHCRYGRAAAAAAAASFASRFGITVNLRLIQGKMFIQLLSWGENRLNFVPFSRYFIDFYIYSSVDGRTGLGESVYDEQSCFASRTYLFMYIMVFVLFSVTVLWRMATRFSLTSHKMTATSVVMLKWWRAAAQRKGKKKKAN